MSVFDVSADTFPGAAPDRPAVAPFDIEALASAIAERLGASEPAPLLDLPAVARWLNVSERLVETFVAAGEIPVLRIGQGRGVRRFEAATVEAFIRRQVTGPTAPAKARRSSPARSGRSA